MTEKLCAACGECLPISEFYEDRRLGRPRHRCKKCHFVQSSANKAKRLGDFGARTREAWTNARWRANKAGLEFTITKEWVRERASTGVCSVTGVPFELGRSQKYRTNPYGISLDRIDPRGGYTEDNTRVVITAFNLMRNEYDDELLYDVLCAWGARRSDGLCAEDRAPER